MLRGSQVNDWLNWGKSLNGKTVVFPMADTVLSSLRLQYGYELKAGLQDQKRNRHVICQQILSVEYRRNTWNKKG